MNIINSNLKFRGLAYGNKPRMLIIHHAEATRCTVEDIHRWHLNNGWSGLGYHYFIRKDGSIYSGRNEEALGAHCLSYNAKSLGICLEGSFNNEAMEEKQYSALLKLTKHLCSKNNINKIYGHRELNNTDCPGKKFPLDRLKREVKLF